MRVRETGELFYLSPTEPLHRVLPDLTKYLDDFPQTVSQREERAVPGLEVPLGPGALPEQVASQLRLSGREDRGQGEEVVAVLDLPLCRDCQICSKERNCRENKS